VKSHEQAAAAFAAAVALAGCAGGPTLERWSRSSGVPPYQAQYDTLRLFVSSAPVPAAASDHLSIKALPDRAGAAYIAALAAKEKTAADLRSDLAKPLTADDSSGTVDSTKVARVLMLGVERSVFRPGDRLLATTVTIRPVGGVRFTDYSLAATDRSAINIGAVTVTNTQSANISVAPGAAAAATEGLTAGLSASRSQTGSRTITNNTELSVHVDPDRIDVYRTGAEGLDLTGNTLIKLALQLPDADARTYTVGEPKLADDAGKPLDPAKVSIDTSQVEIAPARDIYVCATLSFEDRTIFKGRESYDEGRQEVALQSGSTPWAAYLVAPYQDLETPLWVIKSGASTVHFDDHLSRSELTFDDPGVARVFMRWLGTTRRAKLANGDLSAGTTDVAQPIDFSALQVRRLSQTRGASEKPSCDKASIAG